MIEKFDSSNRGSLLKKLGVAAMLLLLAAILLAVWLFVYIINNSGLDSSMANQQSPGSQTIGTVASAAN